MAYKRKTWHEKLQNGRSPKIETVDEKFADVPAGSKLLIPTPQLISDYIKKIPPGVHVTLQQMRKDLAADYHAEYTCPVTSGIFLRIVAEAAYEDYTAGKPEAEITPFWRMVDSKMKLAKKISFDPNFIALRRSAEALKF
jgi:hypothetical protein